MEILFGDANLNQELFGLSREDLAARILNWYATDRNDNQKLVELLLFLKVSDLIEGANYLEEEDQPSYRALVSALTSELYTITPGMLRGCHEGDQLSRNAVMRVIDEKIRIGVKCKTLEWADSHVEFQNDARNRRTRIQEILYA